MWFDLVPFYLVVSLCAPLLMTGCSAGYPARESKSDLVAQKHAQVKRETSSRAVSKETEDLEADLFLTDEGKVLAYSLRAHGGWDAWLALKHVSCTRTRITLEAIRPPGGNQDAPVRRQPDSPALEEDSAPGAEALGGDKDSLDFTLEPSVCRCTSVSPPPFLKVLAWGNECFLVWAPFLLTDTGLRKEYLGIEADAKTGEIFEKVRYFRDDITSDEWVIAFFDRSTRLLKRLFHRDAGGKFFLVLFSDWKDFEGLRIAAKRSVYLMDGLFGHREKGRPHHIDLLSDFHQGD